MGKVVKMNNSSASTTNKNKSGNILFYGDFNCTTGFGNVSKQLIDNWSKNKNFKFGLFFENKNQ